MQKETDLEKIEFFRRTCKERSIKITPQRTAIFEVLYESKDHPSVEKLYDIVKTEFPNISLDTVYRTLMTFVKMEIADIVETQGRARRFDANMDSHHHAHCLKCGNIVDFSSADYDNLEVPRDIRKEFTVISKKVVIHGVCSRCRQEEDG